MILIFGYCDDWNAFATTNIKKTLKHKDVLLSCFRSFESAAFQSFFFFCSSSPLFAISILPIDIQHLRSAWKKEYRLFFFLFGASEGCNRKEIVQFTEQRKRVINFS